jgi:hypothetical protein
MLAGTGKVTGFAGAFTTRTNVPVQRTTRLDKTRCPQAKRFPPRMELVVGPHRSRRCGDGGPVGSNYRERPSSVDLTRGDPGSPHASVVRSAALRGVARTASSSCPNCRRPPTSPDAVVAFPSITGLGATWNTSFLKGRPIYTADCEFRLDDPDYEPRIS